MSPLVIREITSPTQSGALTAALTAARGLVKLVTVTSCITVGFLWQAASLPLSAALVFTLVMMSVLVTSFVGAVLAKTRSARHQVWLATGVKTRAVMIVSHPIGCGILTRKVLGITKHDESIRVVTDLASWPGRKGTARGLSERVRAEASRESVRLRWLCRPKLVPTYLAGGAVVVGAGRVLTVMETQPETTRSSGKGSRKTGKQGYSV